MTKIFFVILRAKPEVSLRDILIFLRKPQYDKVLPREAIHTYVLRSQ
ncbi:hypothetical protein [Helicobacter sp. T3_23-1056]